LQKHILVSEGRIKQKLVQNGAVYVANCDIRIDDGSLHTLILTRNGQVFRLQIDDQEALNQTLKVTIFSFFLGHIFKMANFRNPLNTSRTTYL
jgi:hypothetical protein